MAKMNESLPPLRRLLHLLGEVRPPRHEHHRGGGDVLREVVFGANDGLVSNASLVAAVAGATAVRETILLGGLAGLVAGAISMALGAYVSTRSERELRESEEQREREEIETVPEVERSEIRAIYRKKGFSGKLLDDVVAQLTEDKERWVQVMLTEELGFAEHPPKPNRSAMVMGIAFVGGAVFPVAPYVFLEGTTALVTSLALTAAALFGIGAWRAYLAGGVIWRKAAEMVGLAAVAVLIANGVGRLLGVSIL